jgi:hypothetical protein
VEGFMDTYITDNMVNEGKTFRNVMILGYLFAVLMPLIIWLTNNERYTNRDILLFAIAFFLVGSIGLHGWIYALKYKLMISAEKIVISTLFKEVRISISEITHYNFKRYKKSVFYQFKLSTKNGIYMISTRYCNEFIAVLKQNKVAEDC